VIVVEVVDDASPLALTDHQSQVAKQPQLMGDCRGFHIYRRGQLIDRARSSVQAAEDAYPARSRERLHGVGNDFGEGEVEFAGLRLNFSMGH